MTLIDGIVWAVIAAWQIVSGLNSVWVMLSLGGTLNILGIGALWGNGWVDGLLLLVGGLNARAAYQMFKRSGLLKRNPPRRPSRFMKNSSPRSS